MSGKPDAALKAGQTEFMPDLRSQPGLVLWRRRPGPFIKPTQNHEIGLLKPSLKQSENRNSRMPALRWPDSGVRQDLLQQANDRTRVRIAVPLTRGTLHPCDSSGGLIDRKSVGVGTRLSVRVDLGGRRILQ